MRAVTLAVLAAGAAAASPWGPEPAQKAAAVVAQMTFDQKLAMVHGYGNDSPSNYVGYVTGFPSLGMPATIGLEDGPQGVADQITQVTSFPSSLTVAAAWDEELAYFYGQAMGAEQKAKGTSVMLGPGTNLARIPWGGRNFEYLGEDPVLASKMAAAEVAGVQSNNISACIKHFIMNNQEYNRNTVSANVPQRVAMEAYAVPFKAAVDAGVGTAMCSYNRINGTYACENPTTIGWLKSEWGFQGWLMSDWDAQHSTAPSAAAGLDMEQPDSIYFGQSLAWAIGNGTVPQSRLDDMVTRILTTLFAVGIMGNPGNQPTGTLTSNATSAEHNELSRVLAEKSAILLKNDGGLLPFDATGTTVRSVAVLGDALSVHGWGSGGVYPGYISTPAEAIYELLNGQPWPARPAGPCTVTNGAQFDTSASLCVDVPSQAFCESLCTSDAGCDGYSYQQGRQCNGWGTPGGSCFAVAGPLTPTQSKGFVAGTCPPAAAGIGPRVNVTSYSGSDLVKAAALAAAADVAIVNVADVCSEGTDRPGLSLPPWMDALVAAVAVANPRTAVVARCPGACLMPWVGNVSAVLQQLMPGQESGRAVANLLFGVSNPSGKLPVSFPASMNDTWLGNPVNPAQWPGTDRGNGYLEADYSEELLFGYRWYDAMESTPLFPFGHGLSYSTFAYSALAVSGTVSASNANSSAAIYSTVCNTAGPYGEEVVQLYVGYPMAANEPPKLLKAFTKLRLAPGACGAAGFTLTPADLTYFDVTQQAFVTLPGTYTLYVGSSSRDIRLTRALTVTA